MASVDVAGVGYVLPDGRPLLSEVSFKVRAGQRVALVGDNGAGKTTLLRVVAGEVSPTEGRVTSAGGIAVLAQDVGSLGDTTCVRDLLLGVAPPRVRAAAAALDEAELAMMEADDEPTQLRYASALAEYGDAGGYELEVLWDVVCQAALRRPYGEVRWREARTLSGGEVKRLLLEALLRGPDEVLVLDEPDNFLDAEGTRWLEDQLVATPKTVLYVSHDRELLARTATAVVTVEGGTAWVHGSGFATWAQARRARHERADELRRRWDEEHERLRELVRRLRVQASVSEAMASRYAAAQTRLRAFEQAGPPPPPPPQRTVTMRLAGGRTGRRAVVCEGLALPGLVAPFDLEVWYGDRVVLLGPNGTGKSHLLRLFAGQDVPSEGRWRLGAGVVPGWFRQRHDDESLRDRRLLDVVMEQTGTDRTAAYSALRRYGLDRAADQTFRTLSGGQQARAQVLRLELSGATLLLLDEPTDNLDLASAEALQAGLAEYAGTVVTVTHDRWFARSGSRFLVLDREGRLRETTGPPDLAGGDPAREREGVSRSRHPGAGVTGEAAAGRQAAAAWGTGGRSGR